MDQMRGIPFKGRLINFGAYGDDVKYDDGSPIRWVSLLDETSDRPDATLTATVGSDVDFDALPPRFAEVVAELTVKAGSNNQGKSTGLKFRLTELREVKDPRAAAAASNGKAPAAAGV